MDIIEIIAWLVVSIVGLAIVGVYLPRSSKVAPVEIELQKLRRPSPEAVAKVQARDAEIAKQKAATSSTTLNDVEGELQKLRRPLPEAVAKVQARDAELTRISVANISLEQEELQQLGVPPSEAIKIVKLRGGALKLTTSNSTENKKTTKEYENSLQKSAQVELKEPTEKLTMENMNPDTKKMLTEFLMYPTKDYIGLSNLLSTYNTDSKLRSYLSSRIGLRKAKRKTFYD